MDSDTMLIITWFLVAVGVVSVCGTMYWCYKLYRYIRDPYFEYAVDETSTEEPPPHMYNTLKHTVMRRMANTLRKATKKKVQKVVKRDSSCTVCLEPLNNSEHSMNSSGESALGLLKCNHIFHFECIWRWMRAQFNCPVCRSQANMSVDDIKVISIEAFEKAVASNSLPSYYRKKANKKKIKQSVSKESVSKESIATTTSGEESECSSPTRSPVKSRGDRNFGVSEHFIILEGSNIGESDESLNLPAPKVRSKFRPAVRNHKFKKKSEPDIQTLSLTSLASIPESDSGEMTFTANTSATLPCFGHPVFMGKFTPQKDSLKNAANISQNVNRESETSRSNDDLSASGSQTNQNSPLDTSGNSSSVLQFSKISDKPTCDTKNHLANYTPTMQQLQKLEAITQSNLWSSQISECSGDGVISMLNLVQEQQQVAFVKDAVQEEILKMSPGVGQENKTLITNPNGDPEAADFEEDTNKSPKSVQANWILKES